MQTPGTKARDYGDNAPEHKICINHFLIAYQGAIGHACLGEMGGKWVLRPHFFTHLILSPNTVAKEINTFACDGICRRGRLRRDRPSPRFRHADACRNRGAVRRSIVHEIHNTINNTNSNTQIEKAFFIRPNGELVTCSICYRVWLHSKAATSAPAYSRRGNVDSSASGAGGEFTSLPICCCLLGAGWVERTAQPFALTLLHAFRGVVWKVAPARKR